MLSLCLSLASGFVAGPQATRVAVLMWPGSAGSWVAIDRAGLPVVPLLLGGMLVVVDGSKAPERLVMLRAALLTLLEASRVPGCCTVQVTPKVGSNEPVG